MRISNFLSEETLISEIGKRIERRGLDLQLTQADVARRTADQFESCPGVVGLLKEALIKSGLNFSGDKMFRFKAQIAENSPLFSRFARWKRDMIALKKQFMTYSELPQVNRKASEAGSKKSPMTMRLSCEFPTGEGLE